jgi:sucrose phosphorylase
MWKEIGTTCIHLPQTHHVIQFLRAALNEVTPHVHLITETNVPHTHNISYFGDGTNEAQLVYNFALPPLTLHTFHTGDARILSDWAKRLTVPSGKTTFFNFLASHDGIGLNPARGILSNADIDSLVKKTLAHGGLISYKKNSDGSQSPYEMNINYFDALSNPNGNEPLDLQIDRFIAAQAIMLSLVGVPGIYFHSLFGSRGWLEGVKHTGRNRTINREKCQLDKLQNELADKDSLRARVFTRYRQLLLARSSSSAFQPHGAQRVLDLGEVIFALVRRSPTGNQHVLCLQSVSTEIQTVKVDFEGVFGLEPRGGWLLDLIQGKRFNIRRKTPLHLRPYQTLWLTREKKSK